MIQNETKSPEILKAERRVEQAKARLAEAKRKESAKKRSDENKHKYMMGGIVHKYFPECYGFDEHELNRILAAAIKSEQCQRIIEIVKRESAGKGKNEMINCCLSKKRCHCEPVRRTSVAIPRLAGKCIDNCPTG